MIFKKNLVIRIQLFLLLFVVLKPVFSERITILYQTNNSIYMKIVDEFIKQFKPFEHEFIKVPCQVKDVDENTASVKKTNPDYVFSLGSFASECCFKSKIPGVFVLVPHPVRLNFMDDDLMPTGVMTGILTYIKPEDKIELIQQFIPNKKKISIVYNPFYTHFIVQQYLQCADQFDIQFREVIVTNSEEVLPSFTKLKRSAQAILTFVDPTVYNAKSIPTLIRFSIINKIPFISFSPQMVKAGMTFGIYLDTDQLSIQSAELMKKVMRNKTAQNIPVEWPKKSKYSMNYKVIKIMKLPITKSIINDAENVFK